MVKTLKQIEKAHIEFVLAVHKYNLTVSAKALGIGRATIYRKIQFHQIKLGAIDAG